MVSNAYRCYGHGTIVHFRPSPGTLSVGEAVCPLAASMGVIPLFLTPLCDPLGWRIATNVTNNLRPSIKIAKLCFMCYDYNIFRLHFQELPCAGMERKWLGLWQRILDSVRRYFILRRDFWQNGGELTVAFNLRTLRSACLASALMLLGILVSSLFYQPLQAANVACAAGLSLYTGMGIVLFLGVGRLDKRPLRLRALCAGYLFTMLLLLAYLSSAVMGDVPGLLFAPLAMTLMLLFILPPWLNILVTALGCAALVGISALFKSPQLVGWDVTIAIFTFVLTTFMICRQFWMHLNDFAVLSEMRHRYSTDNLTGVMNKAAAESVAENYLSRFGLREGAALMAIDLERLHQLDERLGPRAVDEALEMFGERLTMLFRRQDIIGRVGNCAFVVVMKKVGNRELLAIRAAAICKMAGDICPDGFDGELACNVGIALCPEHGVSYHTLYVKADAEVFTLKGGDRGGYRIAR
jgi:diguanylate cyclase (GGDEF)-like protein